MDAWILPTLLNIVLGVIAYLGKMQIDTMREEIKALKADGSKHRDDLQNVRSNYLSKEDFRDFKQELYDRMDRNQADLIRQLKDRN